MPFDGNLDLAKAAINRMNIRKGGSGMEMFIHADAPPGSGLGSSSTLVVALLSALSRWKRAPMTGYELAEMAFQVERTDLGIRGGKQDQYSAAFGGLNFIEFTRDSTIVNPLRLPQETLNELEYNLLLCNIGGTRLSSGIIEKQVKNYVAGKAGVLSAMDGMKQLTIAMKNSLLRGEGPRLWRAPPPGMGEQETDGERHQFPADRRDLRTGTEERGFGGKITGAGGGGHMLFYCPFDKKHRVREAVEKHGVVSIPFHFEPFGCQSWEASP